MCFICRCPSMDGIVPPPNCQIVSDPADPCCKMMQCQQPTPAPTFNLATGTRPPVTGSNIYNPNPVSTPVPNPFPTTPNYTPMPTPKSKYHKVYQFCIKMEFSCWSIFYRENDIVFSLTQTSALWMVRLTAKDKLGMMDVLEFACVKMEGQDITDVVKGEFCVLFKSHAIYRVEEEWKLIS